MQNNRNRVNPNNSVKNFMDDLTEYSNKVVYPAVDYWIKWMGILIGGVVAVAIVIALVVAAANMDAEQWVDAFMVVGTIIGVVGTSMFLLWIGNKLWG